MPRRVGISGRSDVSSLAPNSLVRSCFRCRRTSKDSAMVARSILIVRKEEGRVDFNAEILTRTRCEQVIAVSARLSKA